MKIKSGIPSRTQSSLPDGTRYRYRNPEKIYENEYKNEYRFAEYKYERSTLNLHTLNIRRQPSS